MHMSAYMCAYLAVHVCIHMHMCACVSEVIIEYHSQSLSTMRFKAESLPIPSLNLEEWQMSL